MSLPADQVVPSSIPGSTVGLFSSGELFYGMYGEDGWYAGGYQKTQDYRLVDDYVQRNLESSVLVLPCTVFGEDPYTIPTTDPYYYKG